MRIFALIFIMWLLLSCNKSTEESITNEPLHDLSNSISIENLINLGITIIPYEFVEKHGRKNVLQYYYYSEWNDDAIGINYSHSKELFLVKINENEFYVLIKQYLTPFSEEITLHTIARKNENIFIFKTQDGWDNVIVGDFYFDGNNVVLKMDCEKSFNFTGRNLAGRQYGNDIYVFKKRILR